jgi:hypothetical protein
MYSISQSKPGHRRRLAGDERYAADCAGADPAPAGAGQRPPPKPDPGPGTI